MRFILIILLLASVRGFAATGDNIQVVVRPDGYSADVVTEGYGTGGVFNLRMLTNTVVVSTTNGLFTNIWHEPTSLTPRITVHRPSFVKSASVMASNYIVDHVYLNNICRSNYPNQAVLDQRVASGFVTNRFVLTDFITAGDVVVQFDAPATGLYSNSTVTTALSVQNQSTIDYPPPAAARFSWPGNNLESGSAMTLRAVGFAHWPTNGVPLAAMAFIVRGQDGLAKTNIETAMSINWGLGDALPSADYTSTFTLADFANSNQLRCDFIAYPNRGTNIFTTLRDEWTHPTPQPAAITNFYYTNAIWIAVVSEDGTNATGVATNISDPTMVSPAHYFKNGFVAWNAIRGSNNLTRSGCVVYYRTGKTNWSEGTITSSTGDKAWATIAEYPGDTVIFTNHNGSLDINDMVLVKDVELGYLGNVQAFDNINMLWFKDVVWNASGTAPIVTSPAIYVTGGRVERWTQGFRQFSVNNTSFALVRGVDLIGTNGNLYAWHVQGCRKTNDTGSWSLVFEAAAFANAPARHQIIYNNQFQNFNGTAPSQIAGVVAITNGLAFVQNVYENRAAASSFTIASSDLVTSNVLFLNNTIEGVRNQWFYNGTPYTTAIPRYFCHDYNSIYCGMGEATDTDPTANANRVGDWMVRHRVGTRGQIDQMVQNQVVHSAVMSSNIFNFVGPGGALSTNWMQYFLRAGGGVSVGGAGGGDYRMRWGPGLYLPTVQALPYDLFGARRHRLDPPGAIAVSPRVTGFF